MNERNDSQQSKNNELDPRIQIELEKLNNATDEINRLEIELDEANSAFRILMNDSIKKLKVLFRKHGANSIDRARPYYDALELAKQAQQECQRAAVKFQRANEIHQAAKETVALAEARFLSKRHEWEFDSAWQEMLNNAIMKVTDAEHQKTESGREHQTKATLFHAAEQTVQSMDQKCNRYITKTRPYFDEKIRCEDQLRAQKEKVLKLRTAISKAKTGYAASLRRLEDISEEIHLKRNIERKQSRSASPCGPREPGVGAELISVADEESSLSHHHHLLHSVNHRSLTRSPSLDLDFDLDKCDVRSLGSGSVATPSVLSDDEYGSESREDLEELKQKVRELATRPVLSDGTRHNKEDWETELNVAVQKLDRVMHLQECEQELQK